VERVGRGPGTLYLRWLGRQQEAIAAFWQGFDVTRLSAVSPKAPRNRPMAVFRPTSKSTKVSAGHMFAWISSRVHHLARFLDQQHEKLEG